MKILLAVDGSGHSEAVVDAIARQRFSADSEVRIVSVAAQPDFPTSFSGDMSLYVQLKNTAREQANSAVEKAAATLRADEGTRCLKITTDVILGFPKQALLEDAEAFDADLIVVGSHGHGMLERFLLGSVAHAVALHATCSVEIVRTPPTKTGDSR